MEKATRQYNSKNNIFQSTLPRRERLLMRFMLSSRVKLFQSTLPRRERLEGNGSNRRFYSYFNPRSREGSDWESAHKITQGQAISIHAPAKGATARKIQSLEAKIVISIHAPAKGATAISLSDIGNPAYFNPRSREGSD